MKLSESTLEFLNKRYFYKDPETGEQIEFTAEEMMSRVARAVAKAEPTSELQAKLEKEYYDMLVAQLFCPNTPTLIGAGYTNKTLAACSVIGQYPDSLEGIYQYLWKNAKLTKMGAGVGQDLSLIRPKGSIIKSSGGTSAGVTNWMKLISAAADTTRQGDKSRRSANMVTLRFNHPDILDFIHSKETNGTLGEMNISVTITDYEMDAVLNDRLITLEWNGIASRTARARDIMNEIIDGMHRNGEPGILFIDTINRDNPFNIDGNIPLEHMVNSTNPCGEQPLEAFEMCQLGSINLSLLYDKKTNNVNFKEFERIIKLGIRFLDDVIDINCYPFPEFEAKAKGNRKIGLGVAGLAELFVKMGIRYDSQEALDVIDEIFGFKQQTEINYNQELGIEKGTFKNWICSIYAEHGVEARCATISTQAPTGSIANILGLTSYGIEPFFSIIYTRRVVDMEFIEGIDLFKEMLKKEVKIEKKVQDILDRCFKAGTAQIPEIPEKLRNLFRCANDISPEWHLKIQAQLQKYYNNAISKTINAPENASKKDIENIIETAWKSGIKGYTYYRNNSRDNQTIQIGEKNASVELRWGDVVPAPEEVDGTTMKIVSGCGNVYYTVNWDENGRIVQTFINKGSKGTCKSNQEAVSRLMSLNLRAGVAVEEVIDQLESVDICPSYTNARTRGVCVSKGSSCPSALAFKLKSIVEKLKERGASQTEVAQEVVKIVAGNNGQVVAELSTKMKCPECGSIVQKLEGCVNCKACGWSRC